MFGIIGFIIGSIFMSVYGAVADAILILFCMDEEIQKKKGGSVQKAPEPLQEFMKDVDNSAK